MTEIEKYDVVVLGSGEAGKYIAWHLASTGKRVAVIERRYVGGSCSNIACLPYTALRDLILAHPTLSEGLVPLFATVSRL
jgi:pyruvate/2-oxoglutarate dehydrogenase complex dihydrolipoamide dehydrogenase (E3) component